MNILSPIKISIILAFWVVIFFVTMPRAASIKECQPDDAPRFSANGAYSYNELTKTLNISRQRSTCMVSNGKNFWKNKKVIEWLKNNA